MAASSALGRQHFILGGSGRELLALGLQEVDIKEIAGTKVSQKLLDYTGLKKLDRLEVD